MTIGVLQENLVDNAASSQTTIVATITGVAAGSSFHVGVITNHFYTISGVSDSVNGAFTQEGTKSDNSTNATSMWQWKLDGLTAGAHTVTVTFSGSVNAPGTLIWREIGSTSGFNIAPNGNDQTTPGLTADAVTSVAATNTAQPALVSAMCFAIAGTHPTAGTGFTAGQSFNSTGSLGVSLQTESKRITANASQVATFTAATNVDHQTIMAVFTESVARATGSSAAQNQGGM